MEWFGRHRCGGQQLPPTARVIIQRLGEVVFAPAGWWHVVLNVETTTALSHSLALRRDIDVRHCLSLIFHRLFTAFR